MSRRVFLAVAAVLLLALPVLATITTRHVDPVPTKETFVPDDLIQAQKRAAIVPDLITEVREENLYERRKTLLEKGIGMKDVKQTFLLLDSPIIKAEYENYYQPVRFMHGKHISLVDEDCSKCHHLRPADPETPETVACSSCHQKAFDPDIPERVGLKAAYHLQCMTCHQDMKKGPVDCLGCHSRNAPDHKEFVKLGPDPKPWEVTATCLSCHEKQGEDMLRSAHWLWRGPSPYTADRTKEVMSGKATNAVNNF
jgi:hypothetical protein